MVQDTAMTGLRNQLSYSVVNEMVFSGLGHMINKFRRDVLQLPALRLADHGASMLETNRVGDVLRPLMSRALSCCCASQPGPDSGAWLDAGAQFMRPCLPLHENSPQHDETDARPCCADPVHVLLDPHGGA